jgi:N-acetylglucosamine-6-sulfatase
MNAFPEQRRPTRALAAVRLLVSACVLAALVGLILLFNEERARAAEPGVQRPSFVVIQTDDETLDQLYAAIEPEGVPIQAMPNTLALIGERGATFDRYYTPYSLCTPSRVSLLTGRYAHNNNVRGNVEPNGGYRGFVNHGAYSQNLATWLQGAGYRTIHVGKFLNGYGEPPYGNDTEEPPGWSAWHTVLNSDSDHYFYGYSLNDNGTVDGPFGDSGSWVTREYGEVDDYGCPTAPTNGKPCFYLTDVLSRIATEELGGTSPEQPFYLQLDYTAPHGDFRKPAGPQPATRDYDTFAGAPLPHGPSEGLNEGNVNDKPRFIREAPFISAQEKHTYRVYYEKGLESLRSVDYGVKQIFEELGFLHRLRNTYVIFTSDNGFFYGEHRLTGGKFLAYEPSTHLPFLIRGPGIKPGNVTGELASTIDIAPTLLELAGVTPTKSLDGRSLLPYAKDPSLRTRRPLLFESFVQTNDVEQNGGAGGGETTYSSSATASSPARAATASATAADPKAHASILAPPKNYEGIRLGPYKYIEWPDGEKELYDINKDPYELNNKARDKNYAPIRAFLHVELERLESCVGKACSQVAEKLPLTRDQQLKVKREKEKEQRERERERAKREAEREQREAEKKQREEESARQPKPGKPGNAGK